MLGSGNAATLLKRSLTGNYHRVNGSATSYVPSCDALCVSITISIHLFCNLCYSSSSVRTGNMSYPSLPHAHQTIFGNTLGWCYLLQTGNTQQDLQLWRCSDTQFGPCQSHSDPHASPFCCYQHINTFYSNHFTLHWGGFNITIASQ